MSFNMVFDILSDSDKIQILYFDLKYKNCKRIVGLFKLFYYLEVISTWRVFNG